MTARILGEYGADVIKIEPPGQPDLLRVWGPQLHEGRGLLWLVNSRNKKCITLDLRVSKGQDLFRDLVKKADVLVENFRPGTLEKWGIGPAELSAVNPELVVARVSGYGQTGPYASRAGFASVGEAMGGIRHVNGFPDQPPPRFGISLGDTLAALFAVQGVLMALYARRAHRAGGQVVDASILESCFAMLEGTVTEYDKLGLVKGPSGTGLKGVAPSNLYRSRDGKWMVIAANADGIFRRLCQAMGQPELADDPRFATHTARSEHTAEIDARVAEWAGRHDARDIDETLNAAGVVCGPVYTVADIVRDPHYRARDMIVTMTDPHVGEFAAPGLVPKLSGTPGRIRWAGPPEPGLHNDEVYGGLLGLARADMEALRADGVI
jgi:crotonobetainyl-CoA:carnitine CoA-transferase CaiB-like acyl-CoA transferase